MLPPAPVLRILSWPAAQETYPGHLFTTAGMPLKATPIRVFLFLWSSGDSTSNKGGSRAHRELNPMAPSPPTLRSIIHQVPQGTCASLLARGKVGERIPVTPYWGQTQETIPIQPRWIGVVPSTLSWAPSCSASIGWRVRFMDLTPALPQFSAGGLQDTSPVGRLQILSWLLILLTPGEGHLPVLNVIHSRQYSCKPKYF